MNYNNYTNNIYWSSDITDITDTKWTIDEEFKTTLSDGIYSDGTFITNKLIFNGEDDEIVQIQDLQMTLKEFKICMKYLLQLTKNNNPEEFI